MNRIIYALLAMIMAFGGASCGSDEKPQLLLQAQEAARDGKYAEAVDLCNELAASADTASLSAGDYCRVALIYALAADNDVDRENNMAVAAKWLDRANEMSPDSVRSFLSHVPPEQMSVIKQLEQLNLTRGIDFTNFEDPEYGEYATDSIQPHDEL